MKKIIPVVVLAMLCPIFNAKAQSQTDNIKPLKIGDSIPEVVWNMPLQVVNHPEGEDTITLGDYRDRLLIVDFWATYCKPCIKSLEKLDSLNQLFIDRLSVLPVLVYDDAEHALPFLINKGLKLPSVVNAPALTKLLINQYFSGFGNVWIYKGKLYAVPLSKYLTAENIACTLAGMDKKFPDRVLKTSIKLIN